MSQKAVCCSVFVLYEQMYFGFADLICSSILEYKGFFQLLIILLAVDGCPPSWQIYNQILLLLNDACPTVCIN